MALRSGSITDITVLKTREVGNTSGQHPRLVACRLGMPLEPALFQSLLTHVKFHIHLLMAIMRCAPVNAWRILPSIAKVGAQQPPERVLGAHPLVLDNIVTVLFYPSNSPSLCPHLLLGPRIWGGWEGSMA